MVMLGQVVMALIVAFAIFKVTCEGDIGWIGLLNVFTGLCGMCFGNPFIILILNYCMKYQIPKFSYIKSSDN